MSSSPSQPAKYNCPTTVQGKLVHATVITSNLVHVLPLQVSLQSITGIPGNEMADILARKGLEKREDTQRKGTMSLPHLRRVIKMQVLTAWKD